MPAKGGLGGEVQFGGASCGGATPSPPGPGQGPQLGSPHAPPSMGGMRTMHHRPWLHAGACSRSAHRAHTQSRQSCAAARGAHSGAAAHPHGTAAWEAGGAQPYLPLVHDHEVLHLALQHPRLHGSPQGDCLIRVEGALQSVRALRGVRVCVCARVHVREYTCTHLCVLTPSVQPAGLNMNALGHAP